MMIAPIPEGLISPPQSPPSPPSAAVNTSSPEQVCAGQDGLIQFEDPQTHENLIFNDSTFPAGDKNSKVNFFQGGYMKICEDDDDPETYGFEDWQDRNWEADEKDLEVMMKKTSWRPKEFYTIQHPDPHFWAKLRKQDGSNWLMDQIMCYRRVQKGYTDFTNYLRRKAGKQRVHRPQYDDMEDDWMSYEETRHYLTPYEEEELNYYPEFSEDGEEVISELLEKLRADATFKKPTGYNPVPAWLDRVDDGPLLLPHNSYPADVIGRAAATAVANYQDEIGNEWEPGHHLRCVPEDWDRPRLLGCDDAFVPEDGEGFIRFDDWVTTEFGGEMVFPAEDEPHSPGLDVSSAKQEANLRTLNGALENSNLPPPGLPTSNEQRMRNFRALFEALDTTNLLNADPGQCGERSATRSSALHQILLSNRYDDDNLVYTEPYEKLMRAPLDVHPVEHADMTAVNRSLKEPSRQSENQQHADEVRGSSAENQKEELTVKLKALLGIAPMAPYSSKVGSTSSNDHKEKLTKKLKAILGVALLEENTPRPSHHSSPTLQQIMLGNRYEDDELVYSSVANTDSEQSVKRAEVLTTKLKALLGIDPSEKGTHEQYAARSPNVHEIMPDSRCENDQARMPEVNSGVERWGIQTGTQPYANDAYTSLPNNRSEELANTIKTMLGIAPFESNTPEQHATALKTLLGVNQNQQTSPVDSAYESARGFENYLTSWDSHWYSYSYGWQYPAMVAV